MERMTRRDLTPSEFAVIRHLGVHCGAGGQVLLRRWQREAAIGPWRMGLVGVWLRLTPDIGADGTFYSLTTRGQSLAATLSMARQNRVVRVPPT
jgi:hypothetical protein